MLDLISNLTGFLQTFGYAALFAIVFAESGLFFGFFLPGDSLLFVAGLLASQGILDIGLVTVGIAVSAILGDQVGYWMGQKYGRGFFNKPGSLFRDPRHVAEAEKFYQKHGKKTIVLARFVPAVRTFAPIVAGIGKMEYKTFVTYNVAGGILWTLLFVGLGYFLGTAIPNAGEYLTVLVLAVIVLSLVPLGLEYWKHLSKKNKTKIRD